MIDVQAQKRPERALLVGLEQGGVSKWDLADSLDELRELASSAGAQVVNTVTQRLDKPTAPFYIGKGKAAGDQGVVSGSAGHLGYFR